MEVHRALPLTLSALAVVSSAALVTFDIIFAVTLSNTSSPTAVRVTAIVASGLGSISLTLLLLLLGQQFRSRNRAHIQGSAHGRQHTYLLAACSGVFGVLSTVVSALELGMIKSTTSELPKRIISSSTDSLVVGSFIVWATALLSQALFLLDMVIIQRRDLSQTIQTYEQEKAAEPPSQMKERNASPVPPSGPGSRFPGPIDPKAPATPSKRSRAFPSLVVRPITSKTKLISSKSPHSPNSVKSSFRDTGISIEDSFDLWDTSAVDLQSRQALESASSTPPRFLETIPASPTTSRSASPGFPLDLEPPKRIRRSRSYSPAASYVERPKSKTTSPAESTREAHIHPLFRTDSPDPPPTTPGTMVTAAPGAGQLISDRESIRSLHRMRSGSLPSSPASLLHQSSLESIRAAIIRREAEKENADDPRPERQLTPPIPEYILAGVAPRHSMSGYSRRKPASLKRVGEQSGSG